MVELRLHHLQIHAAGSGVLRAFPPDDGEAIGQIGGPRCCKRDSYLSILSAIDFVKEHFGVEMEKQAVICNHSAQNNQCIGRRCPFNRADQRDMS